MAAKKEARVPAASLVETVGSVPPLVGQEDDLTVYAGKRHGLLRGKRRILDRRKFEKLCMIQCEVADILGYAGTTQEKLESWCNRVYHRPLSQMMEWIRADGRVELREAIFREVGSPSILNNIFNRYLPELSSQDAEENQGLQQLVDAIMGVQPDVIRGVFADEADGSADHS